MANESFKMMYVFYIRIGPEEDRGELTFFVAAPNASDAIRRAPLVAALVDPTKVWTEAGVIECDRQQDRCWV